MPSSNTIENLRGFLCTDNVPQSSSQISLALTDTETLRGDVPVTSDLPGSYADNFEEHILRGGCEERHLRFSPTNRYDEFDQVTLNSDILHCGKTVLGKDISVFNVKRDFIVAKELFRNDMYLFLSKESFKQFKELKLRKASHGDLLKVGSNHSITHPEREIQILPVLKLHFPHFASIRKNTPYLVFKGYRSLQTSPNHHSGAYGAERFNSEFETFDFCSVQFKNFYKIRRYILEFTPIGEQPFKVLVFQHNFKPFADFIYQGTRFRICGTSTTENASSYTADLRLCALDDSMASLCDAIVDRPAKLELSSLRRKKSSLSHGCGNPYPDPNSKLLQDKRIVSVQDSHCFHPKGVPPFGSFRKAELYGEGNLVPKKISEVAKFETYQDGTEIEGDLNGIHSLDSDSLVLNCIMLALRETHATFNSESTNGGMKMPMETLTHYNMDFSKARPPNSRFRVAAKT